MPRLVVTLHGTDVTALGADAALRPVVRHVALASDALSVPSAWLRDQACGSSGSSPARSR